METGELTTDPMSEGKESLKQFENFEIGVVLYDANAKPIRCNEAACSILGLTEDQFSNKSAIDEYLEIIKIKGREFEITVFPIVEAINAKKPVYGEVIGVPRKQFNDTIWLEVNADPLLNRDGSVYQIICTLKVVSIQNNERL